MIKGHFYYQHFIIFEMQNLRKNRSLNKYAKCERKLTNQLAK